MPPRGVANTFFGVLFLSYRCFIALFSLVCLKTFYFYRQLTLTVPLFIPEDKIPPGTSKVC